MITINKNGCMAVPEEDAFIGYAGDNLNTEKEILVQGISDISLVYRMYLKFDDGTCNFFLLDKEITSEGTKLIWRITADQIYKSGIVKVQIKASNSSGEVFHSNITNMLVQTSIEFCDSFKNKENSEFLQLEQKLNELDEKQRQAAEELNSAAEALSSVELDSLPTAGSGKPVSSGGVYSALEERVRYEDAGFEPGGTGGLNQARDPKTLYNVVFTANCGQVSAGSRGKLFVPDENNQIYVADNGQIYTRYYIQDSESWSDFVRGTLSPIDLTDEVAAGNNKPVSGAAVESVTSALRADVDSKVNYEDVSFEPGGTGGLNQARDPKTLYNVVFTANCGQVSVGSRGKLFVPDENNQIYVADNGQIYTRYYIQDSESWSDFVRSTLAYYDIVNKADAESGTIGANEAWYAYDSTKTMTGTYQLIGDYCFLSATAQRIDGWGTVYYSLPVAWVAAATTAAVNDTNYTINTATQNNISVLEIMRVDRQNMSSGELYFTLIYKYR